MNDAIKIQKKLNDYLERLSPQKRVLGKPKAEQDEADALLRCLLKYAPKSNVETWLDRLFDFIEENAKYPTWPTVSEISAACRALQAESGSVSRSVIEESMIERLIDFFKKTGKQLPGCGSPSRTQALIDRGVLKSYREARHLGFDLSEAQNREALTQGMEAGERNHHIAVMARLKGVSFDEMAFNLEGEDLVAQRGAAE